MEFMPALASWPIIIIIVYCMCFIVGNSARIVYCIIKKSRIIWSFLLNYYNRYFISGILRIGYGSWWKFLHVWLGLFYMDLVNDRGSCIELCWAEKYFQIEVQ